jgi:hypothetical protein
VGGKGSGGWNRRSAEQHRVDGTFRPDRHARRATRVVPIGDPAPPPPETLSAPARERWVQLVGEFAGWDAGQLHLLELALLASDRATACRERIARDGLIVKGHVHPLMRLLRSEERFMLDTLRQLRAGAE